MLLNTPDPINISEEAKLNTNFDSFPITSAISDEDLAQAIKADYNRDRDRFEMLKKIEAENYQYWKGYQLDPAKTSVGDSQIVDNRIAISIETMCSIITATTPDPFVTVSPRTKSGLKHREKVQRWLRDMWEYHLNMQQKMERTLRNYYMARYAMLKVGYDPITKTLFTEKVPTKNLKFDLDAVSIDDSPYVVEDVSDLGGVIKAKFPDKKNELEELFVSRGWTDRTKIPYLEHWATFYENGETHVMLSWLLDDLILKRVVDPYWNSNGNHFKFPRKAYIPMNSMSIGTSIVDDISLIEQSKSLQNSLNDRKNQISRNAWLANGIMVGMAPAMNEKLLNKINPKTTKILLQETEYPEGSFRIVTGRPFEQGIFEDMAQTIREIDNLFGTHDTTRGEQGKTETASGRMMLRDADYGRQDLTARAYEQVAEEIMNWWLQLAYVYDLEHEILSERDSDVPMDDFYKERGLVPTKAGDDKLSRKELKKFKFRVIVKKGTTKPDDEVANAQDAVTLAQTGMIDPLSFAELYGIEDPRKFAKRVFMYTNMPDKMFPELMGEESVIDPTAIQHIRRFATIKDPETLEQAKRYIYDAFENPELPTMEELEAMSKHLSTHALYNQGVELEEDMPIYSDLSEMQRLKLDEHLAIEKEILNTEINNFKTASSMGMGAPMEAPGEVPTEVPPAEVSPEMPTDLGAMQPTM